MISPKLTLVSFFALVVSDIYLTIAPLIPSFQGTIPQILIIPVAIAVGIGIVCNLLIFPQSTSHIVLDSMSEILILTRPYIDALSWHLQHPESRFDMKRLNLLSEEILVAYKNLDSYKAFLPMDFSYGKWSPAEVTSLQEPLKKTFISFSELMQLAMSQEEARMKGDALNKFITDLNSKEEKQTENVIAYHQIIKTVNFRAYARHPDTSDMITKTLHTLSGHATPLLQSWQKGLDGCIAFLTEQSSVGHNNALQDGRLALSLMEKSLQEFESQAGQSMIDLHSSLFDVEGKIITAKETSGHPPTALGLIIGLLYQERLINMTKAIIALLQGLLGTMQQHRNRQLWLPGNFQHIISWGLSKEKAPPIVLQKNLQLERTATVRSQKKNARIAKRKSKKDAKEKDPNSAETRLEDMRSPKSRQRWAASNALLSIIRWLFNDDGILALRTLIATIALAVPAVIPSSAGFYYREKGMWALVMAQFSIVPFASDFVFGLIIRTTATIAGGILGLLCWYIGAGSGPGNAYGLAAVMAVAIVIMMWWRLFAPSEHMTAGIMLTSTMYLVVAYSWIDTHIPSYGNPGVGYEIFWRRILLVLIGFLASTVVTFLPRPASGNKHYRDLLSGQISSVADRYALFVSTWSSPPDDLVEVIEKESIASDELLSSLLEPIRNTKYEFTTSNIDTDTLIKAHHLCANLNIYMTQLLVYNEKLPSPLRSLFMRTVGADDEAFVADFMSVLALVQHSLASGSPLPAMMPTPLLTRTKLSSPGRSQSADRSSTETKLILKEKFAQSPGRQWIIAVHAFVRLLGTVDDLVIVVKTAVGEVSNMNLSALNEQV
jgi:hypothetical protein